MAEVKSADGGKGRKCPYCNLEEGVQKHDKYPRLWGNLRHDDHGSSGPHSAPTSPEDTLKKIKGCVEGQNLV